MGSACCGTAKVEPLNPADSLPSDWSPLVAHAFFSHEGGAGGLGKENQDVVFVAQPSAEIGIFGVLDGHGKEHGRLAAQVGAAALRSHLTAEHLRLAEDSESVLTEAFASAHAAIRDAILRADTTNVREGADGSVLQWLLPEDDDEEARWDAAAGGTTATLAVLIAPPGGAAKLVVAAVGDSAAHFLARGADGRVAPTALFEEHAPTNEGEHKRMAAGPRGKELMWLYDCPSPEDGLSEKPPIFDGDGRPDLASQKTADDLEVRIKNARGDRCTVILIPEEEVAVVDPPTGRPAVATVDEQNLTMTRSLGDFHAHRYGVSHAPDVRTFALADLLAGADSGGVAALCSDGVWDLMDEREVGEVLWPAEAAADGSAWQRIEGRAATLCEAARARGSEWFGESADNLTGVLIDLRSVSGAEVSV